MPEKLKSRKFWNALVGEIVGIVTLFCGITQGEQVAVIAGAAITVAVVLGYLKAAKDVDVARESR